MHWYILQILLVRFPYKPEFSAGFLFATAKVAYITVIIYIISIRNKLLGLNFKLQSLTEVFETP